MRWLTMIAGLALIMGSSFLVASRLLDGRPPAALITDDIPDGVAPFESFRALAASSSEAAAVLDREVPVRRMYELAPDQVAGRTPFEVDIEGVPFKVDHPMSDQGPWTLRLQSTSQTGWRRHFVRRVANKPAGLRFILDREHALAAQRSTSTSWTGTGDAGQC